MSRKKVFILDKYIVTLMNGMEEELSTDYKIIDARNECDMNLLFSNKKVRYLNSNSLEPYGLSNKLWIDRKKGYYRLMRDGVFITGECERIVPIKRTSTLHFGQKMKDQLGIIYLEFLDQDNCFLSYKICMNDSLNEKKFISEYTPYCILNMETGSVIAIKDFRLCQLCQFSGKREIIADFIQCFSETFTLNEMKEILLKNHVITIKELTILIRLLDSMVSDGILIRYADQNHEIRYSKPSSSLKKRIRI